MGNRIGLGAVSRLRHGVKFLVAWLLVGIASLAGAEAVPLGSRAVHRSGKFLISLPASGTQAASEAPVPVWIHLHGAPSVVEANFAASGASGVWVNLTLPGLSKVYADHFADAAVFPQLLAEIEALLQRETPARRPGRVTITSFSAGFGGVRQLLRQREAFARIDALVMADSIYCGYRGDAALKQVDEALMAGFVEFARLAVDGRKRLVISHSRQVPEGYASTTETANYLLRQLDLPRKDAEPETWAAGLRLTSRATRGGFEVLGFEGASFRSLTRPVLTTLLGALLVAGLLLTVYTESLREFFDFTSVETTDWIIVLTAVAAALAGQWALSRYWQQFLDILTAAPRKSEKLRGRAV